MTYFCAVTFETLCVVLNVHFDGSGDWIWTLRLASSKVVLDDGIAVSKDIAQLAAQCAFEDRLHRAGLSSHEPAEYEWKKLIGE